MFMTSYEALEPNDLTMLRDLLVDIMADRQIDEHHPEVAAIGQALIDLWLSGFRSADELRAMLKPLDHHLVQ
ncbi:hypothetical protein [Rhizobium sp.]|uniref:hypothetical protein n=1 Tax=Rhizobium sp. TaxID=391 RepID=UPI00289837EE